MNSAVRQPSQPVTSEEPTTPAGVSRRGVLVGASVGTLLTTLLTRGGGQAAAQESTPAITSGGQGVSAQIMGVGQPSTASGLELSLRRITIAPGGGLAPHTHPGMLVVAVESGTWGHTSIGGTAQLTRAAVDGTPQPTEEVEKGVEVILTAGDVLVLEDSEDHMRNAGEDDVVLLTAGLMPAGEPFTTFMEDMEGMDMESTPTS